MSEIEKILRIELYIRMKYEMGMWEEHGFSPDRLEHHVDMIVRRVLDLLPATPKQEEKRMNSSNNLTIEKTLRFISSFRQSPKNENELKQYNTDTRLIEQQLLALKSKWETAVEKAYGGCRNCYGKGYSTCNDQTIGYPDFPGDKGFKTNNHRMIFCDCSRGKQLEAELNQLTTNGDK